MLVENQFIQVFWSSRVKSYYESKGYIFTNRSAPFMVRAEDLSPLSQKHVRVLCDSCGIEFSTPFNRHFARVNEGKDDLCRGCASKHGHDLTKQVRAHRYFEELCTVCHKNNYTLITEETQYTDINMKIDFECRKHGLQSMSLYNLLHGHQCPRCSYESRGEKSRNDIDYIEQVINSFNGNRLLNKEEYIGANTRNLKVLCGRCGCHVFTVSFSDYTNVKVQQCRSCSSAESVGERLISECLCRMNIKFEREKRFADCKDKTYLPFDFYIPYYRLAIEFDGQHHFKNIWGEDHLRTTKRHDRIKDEYCAQNNIYLLRIPYWEGHNIDEILQDTISKL